jgi:hypothetical protein
MNMSKEEAQAVGILRSNAKAWELFMGYLDKRLEFEKDACVDVDDELKNKVHRGKAKAFRDIINLDKTVDRIFRTG